MGEAPHSASIAFQKKNHKVLYRATECFRLLPMFQELREANYKVVEIAQQQEIIFKKHLEELKANF